MSIQIDPREVLEHLQYLGYRSITKEQLKEFIRDLKRLIKYEEYKGKSGLKGTLQSGDKVSVACETSFPYNGFINNASEGTYDILSGHHEKENSGNYSPITTLRSPDSTCRTCEEKSVRSYRPDDYIEDEVKCRACCSCEGSQKNPSEKTSSRIGSKKSQEVAKPPQPIPSWKKTKCPTFSGGISRRQTSKIIRPGTGKPSKCDPVALYHYYQNQWAKRPLPGEDPRADLRWAVRTRLAQQQQASQQKTTCFDGQPRRKLKEWIS